MGSSSRNPSKFSRWERPLLLIHQGLKQRPGGSIPKENKKKVRSDKMFSFLAMRPLSLIWLGCHLLLYRVKEFHFATFRSNSPKPSHSSPPKSTEECNPPADGYSRLVKVHKRHRGTSLFIRQSGRVSGLGSHHKIWEFTPPQLYLHILVYSCRVMILAAYWQPLFLAVDTNLQWSMPMSFYILILLLPWSFPFIEG